MTKETVSSASTAHPRAFNATKSSSTCAMSGVLIGGSIAVAKKNAIARKVMLDKCHMDSECGRIVSWLIERMAKVTAYTAKIIRRVYDVKVEDFASNAANPREIVSIAKASAKAKDRTNFHKRV